MCAAADVPFSQAAANQCRFPTGETHFPLAQVRKNKTKNIQMQITARQHLDVDTHASHTVKVGFFYLDVSVCVANVCSSVCVANVRSSVCEDLHLLC